MKIRLRFQGSTKVLSIEQDQEESFSLADVRNGASQLFQIIFDENHGLSLNRKDFLEDETSLLSSFGIVSGDLLHIISKTEPEVAQQGPSRPVIVNSTKTTVSSSSTTPGYQNRPSRTHDESQKSSELSKDSDRAAMDIDQPGPSYEFSPVAGTSTDQPLEQDEDPVDFEIVDQCLHEPILCREATEGRVPSLLCDVYSVVQPETEAEALSVVLHVLMIETGFTVHPEPMSSHVCVPDKWKYPGYYKFTYTYPGCQDICVSLTVITTGNSLALHGKVSGDDGATRMCSLKPTDYVKRVSSDCSQCYCQLAKLNIVFKDSIATPLLHDVRAAAGLEEVYGLMALTFELKLRILSFLDVQSLLRMSQVNSQMADITKDPFLWRRLYLKTFGNRRDNSLSQDWKKLFMQEYKARKERRKLISKMLVVPPLVPTRTPFSNTAPWLPPNQGGIIGGDYDLYPNFQGNLPGLPGRGGHPSFMLPRPRYDLIGPSGVNPNPDPGLLPQIPGRGRGRGPRPGPFGGGFSPNFF